ncbi:MAG: Trk system potassium transporter TrkA [Desulfatibacillum sp.]|nr:Trk system potassium transporter TrkA [Desulfatibacillum sp.]
MKILIVGAGEVGFHIASRLATENKDVVVIDKDPRALKRVSEQLDVQVFEGSGSSPEVLKEAGISQCDILLAVTDSDETNLVSCLVCDLLSPATRKLIRIRDSDYTDFTDRLKADPPHIDTVINPEVELVHTVQRLLAVPGAEDVAEFADGAIKLIGVRLDERSALASIRLTSIRDVTGEFHLLIAAIVRDEELIIPTGRDSLLPGDLVYFVTDQANLHTALKLFGKESRSVKRAFIVGGGRIGLRLAKALEKDSVYVKIVEEDAQRCSVLADTLNNVVVLHGDGTDQGLLAEENIEDMDVVITVTGDEETNILTSLLAKRMGVPIAITRINKFGYFPLTAAIGIEHVISSRLSAINTILGHVRRGKVLSSVSLKGERAEVLEAEAMETADIVGKPLKNISFPKGSLVISIIRDSQVIIPRGDSVIQPADRIILLCSQQAIPKIEKALAVKLEFF